jgi:hypothetical protein
VSSPRSACVRPFERPQNAGRGIPVWRYDHQTLPRTPERVRSRRTGGWRSHRQEKRRQPTRSHRDEPTRAAAASPNL